MLAERTKSVHVDVTDNVIGDISKAHCIADLLYEYAEHRENLGGPVMLESLDLIGHLLARAERNVDNAPATTRDSTAGAADDRALLAHVEAEFAALRPLLTAAADLLADLGQDSSPEEAARQLVAAAIRRMDASVAAGKRMAEGEVRQ